jgi:hypothetical protein
MGQYPAKKRNGRGKAPAGWKAYRGKRRQRQAFAGLFDAVFEYRSKSLSSQKTHLQP